MLIVLLFALHKISTVIFHLQLRIHFLFLWHKLKRSALYSSATKLRLIKLLINIFEKNLVSEIKLIYL
jgi:hypothetical protein